MEFFIWGSFVLSYVCLVLCGLDEAVLEMEWGVKDEMGLIMVGSYALCYRIPYCCFFAGKMRLYMEVGWGRWD